MNKIVKILGTPDKNDWPEGYKLAQAKSNSNYRLRLLFSTLTRNKSFRHNS